MHPPEGRGRLAVLGADGFIGSALVRAALSAGWEPTAVTIKSPWRLRGLAAPDLVRVPLGDERWWLPERSDALRGALRRADALALLAYTPPPHGAESRLEHERSVNVRGVRAVAELAAGAGLRTVFTSSADVYGRWHREPVDESTEPDPATPYAAAKLEAEAEVRRACSSSTCLRLATVYGPGENGPRAIPAFIRALARGEEPIIHGDGSDVHDYVHVDDVATAILAALAAAPRAPLYNVGSGVGRTTSSVLRAVTDAIGCPARGRNVHDARPPSRLVIDGSAIAEELGFRSRVRFEEGLRGEVDWLLGHLAGDHRAIGLTSTA